MKLNTNWKEDPLNHTNGTTTHDSTAFYLRKTYVTFYESCKPWFSGDFPSSSAALIACSNLSSNQDLSSFTLRSPNTLSLGSAHWNQMYEVWELQVNKLIMTWEEVNLYPSFPKSPWTLKKDPLESHEKNPLFLAKETNPSSIECQVGHPSIVHMTKVNEYK